MKKRTLALISSAASLVVCGSLIAGSTYALFTSKDEVNIAVTSGKVSVSANIVDWDNAKENPENKTTFITSTTLEGAEGALVTPVLNGNEVAINGMVPGDKVEFDIKVENTSTVSVKYRTKIECTDGYKLMGALNVELGELSFKGYKTYATAWETLEAGAGNEIVHASIELPEIMDENFMGLNAKITYSVEAVQGNAGVSDGEEYELLPYAAITDAEDYIATLAAYAEAQTPAEVILMSDIEANIDWADNALMGYRFDEDFTIDFNGHSVVTNAKLMATANMTLKNGYLYMTTKQGTGGLDVSIDGVLNVENMEYSCVSNNTCIVVTRNAAVNVKNSKLYGTWYTINTNASAELNSKNNITVENSELTAAYCGILFNVPGNLVLKNTKVSGGEQAVFLRCGDAVIDGCEFTQTLQYNGKYDNKNWSSGNEAPYGALVIGNRSTSAYRTPANATVTNTTLENNESAYSVYMYGNTEEGLGATLVYDAKSDLGEIVQGDNGANTFVYGADFLTVKTGKELIDAVKVLNEQGQDAVICLANDIELSEQLFINRYSASLVIDGNGYKITAADDFKLNLEGQFSLVKLNSTSNKLTLKNVTLEHAARANASGSYHTLDVYACSDVNLVNVKLSRNFVGEKGGAALVLNGATVNADNLSIEVGGNAWYGVNVDAKNGESKLKLTGNFTYADNDDLLTRFAVFCENSGKLVAGGDIVDAATAGYTVNADGQFETAYTATAEGLFVYNACGLANFAATVNGGNTLSGVTVTLMDDVDLNGINWTPIGNKATNKAFSGTFDGNGKTISNLNVEVTDGVSSAGLFGWLNQGTIKNFNLNNVTINTNCANHSGTGAVVGQMYTGGLVEDVHVTNVNINAVRQAGGIVGHFYGTVRNCSVTGGSITATPNKSGDSYDNGDKVGGIAGFMNGDSGNVYGNSVNDLTLTAYRDVGGIGGTLYSGSVATFKNNTVNNVTVILDDTLKYADEATNAGVIIGRFCNNLTTADIDASNVATDCVAIGVNGVILQGEVTLQSQKDTVIEFNGDNVHFFIPAGAVLENVTIKGLNARTAAKGASPCIEISAEATVKNLVIEECYFTGDAKKDSKGLYRSSATSEVTFKGCTFENMGRPIYDNYCGFKKLVITGCKFINDCSVPNADGLMSWPIAVYGDIEYLEISDCEFVGCVGIAKIQKAGVTLVFKNNKVTDCKPDGYGWIAGNYENVEFGNNTKDGEEWTLEASGIKYNNEITVAD